MNYAAPVFHYLRGWGGGGKNWTLFERGGLYRGFMVVNFAFIKIMITEMTELLYY